jgi:alpha-galactosidase
LNLSPRAAGLIRKFILASVGGLAAFGSGSWTLSAAATHEPFQITEGHSIYEGTATLSGNVPVEYYLDIVVHAHYITGRVHMTWGWDRIRTSSLNGDRFTLHLDDAIPIYIEGQSLKDALALTIYDPRSAPFTVTVHPVGSLPPPSLPLPLPALADLSVNRTFTARPPMGWNSWNHFSERIDDATVRQIADAMVRTGMRDAGYKYLIVDEGWAGLRDTSGHLRGNAKFPDMKRLAEYIHSRGLLFGLYSSPGPLPCGAYPGSYGHEEADAETFATWGIDYLKYDWCSAGEVYPAAAMRAVYQKMGAALQHTGHPIVFAICQYGEQEVWRWGAQAGGGLWRVSADIQDNWRSVRGNALADKAILNENPTLRWTDPDLLEVGNGGMSDLEYQTHMSLWALLGAPLIASNDPRRMTPETAAILLNPEVVALDQDQSQQRPEVLTRDADLEIWKRYLHDGSLAVGIVNLSGERKSFFIPWRDFGVRGAPSRLRDLWKQVDLPERGGGVSGRLEPHQTLLVVLQGLRYGR